LALGLSVLTFGPAVGFGLVWDDTALYDSPLDPGRAADWLRAFTLELGDARLDTEEGPTGYYRPLVVCSFLLDRAIGGVEGAASVGHLQSIGWQLLGVFALSRVLLRLRFGPAAAAVALVVFALHPLQVEPTVWLSARNDLMVSVFILGALGLALPTGGPAFGLGRALLVFGLGLAAALSKELGLVAPLVLLIAGAPPRALLASALGVGAAVALRGAVGAQALGFSAAQVWAVLPATAAISARDLLWPVGLHPGERLGWSPAAPLGPLWAGLGLGAALLAAGRGRARTGLLLAGLAWAPSLAAVSQLGLVGLRYHHLCLAGLGLAIGAAADRWASERAARALVVGLGLLGLVTSQRALLGWTDDGAFWEAAVARHPNPYTWTGRAHQRRSVGELEGAAADLKRATTGPDLSPMACFGVSSLALRRGMPAEAAAEGLRALQAGCAPSPELLAPTAVGLVATGRWSEAQPLIDAVHVDPTGMAVVVRVALEARVRQRAAWDGAGAPSGLAEQSAYLLEQGGDPESAAWLRAAARVGPPG